MNDARRTLIEELGEDTPFLCSLATLREDGGPAVRFVRAKADAELTLRIPTFVQTAKVKQIRADGRVHITCGRTDSSEPGSYFQIDGVAEILTEAADREACWTERLEKWFSGPDDPNYAVVRVTPSRITALPIGRAGKPTAWQSKST